MLILFHVTHIKPLHQHPSTYDSRRSIPSSALCNIRVPEMVYSVCFQQAQARRKPDLDAENEIDTAGAAAVVTIWKPACIH